MWNVMERVTGIELVTKAWEAAVIPFHHTRALRRLDRQGAGRRQVGLRASNMWIKAGIRRPSGPSYLANWEVIASLSAALASASAS